MAGERYRVTRLAGAPARRAGRVWEEDAPTVTDLSPAQVAALADDPRYLVVPLEADPAPARTSGARRKG